MSLHIRKLPGKCGPLIERKDYLPHHVYFNPSADGAYTYIRVTQHTPVKEINHILIHDNNTQLLHWIADSQSNLRPTCGLFTGIEDLRIVVFEGKIWFTATTTHASAHMDNEIVVGCLDEKLKCVEYMSLVNIAPRPVKNICPFVWRGRLHLLDAYMSTIWEIEMERDPDSAGTIVGLKTTKVRSLRYAADNKPIKMRGSTSPVHLHGNTWGFVVHDIIFNDNAHLVTRLSYFHYWVEMDIERGVITFKSAPFFLAHWGIEYVSGLRYVAENDQMEVYFGVNDTMPMKCVTSLANLRCGK
jgi:hypothetical protein